LTKANTRNSNQSAISSVNYIVNTLGQRKERTTTDAANNSATTEWTYDTLGQVTSEDQPGTTTDRAYQYDTIGNRKKSANSLTLPDTDNYTSNALNQYTSITSGQLTSEPQYDFDGNMTHGPHPADPSIPALFYYDAENRLLEIRNATTGVTLQSNHYDAFSRLIRVTALHNVQSTTEYILWKGWTLVSRFVSSGNSHSETFHYTWGTDLSGSEQGAGGVGGLLAITRVPATGDFSTRYPLYDGNGNITALVTTNGTLSATYQYDAFGNTLNATDNDASGWVNHNIHGFSTKPTFGHQGLHYYGYRWYTAKDGRWINRDPIAERGGVNLYGFVGNDGVNRLDYLGMVTCSGTCGADITDWIYDEIQEQSKGWDSYKKSKGGNVTVEDYLMWANGNQRYKDGNFFEFSKGTSCGTKTGAVGCGKSVTLCGKCVRSAILGNIMYGLIGRTTFYTHALVGGANDTKKNWGMTVDPYDSLSYQLGAGLAEDLDMRINVILPKNKYDFCDKFSTLLRQSQNNDPIKEGDGKAGFNDLSTCVPCTDKTTETRHGGKEKPRKTP
jgi:RHS repeat-associated protein